DADSHRAALGDEAFFANLNRATTMPEGTGVSAQALASGVDIDALIGQKSSQWDAATYAAAVAPNAEESSRTALIQALTQTMFSSYADSSPWLGIAEGLRVISEHAKTLGYDGVIYYLDELILWLMFMIPTRAEFNREAQKLTLLVENEFGAAIPMVFFIARQFDLATWQDKTIESGSDLEARQKAFDHQGGRFHTINLGNRNLPEIANRRLLTPRSAQAKLQLDEAFSKLDLNPDITTVLLDGVNTSEQRTSATMNQFRLTYPFSPALVDTLIALSSIMQRERTALKVMEQMLIDNRDTMTIDRIIPVGDAFDYLLTGDKHINVQGGERFRLGRKFWSESLRPHILNKYSLPADTPDHELPTEMRALHAELRIGKTLVLAGIAPEVPALKALTVSRLAHLNHGSMVTMFRNDSLSQTMELVEEWAREFTEIVIQPGTTNPVLSVRLDEVPWKDLVQQAQREDTPERKRLKIRSLLVDALGVKDVAAAHDGSLTRVVTWRGTARQVEVIFGNVRDDADLTDSAFRPFQAQALRLVVDFPFDDQGHTPAEDHQRVNKLQVSDGEAPFTVVWLPQFFTNDQMEKLGELVIIEQLLTVHGWRDYSVRIPEDHQESVKQILRSRADTLNTSLERELAQAYGAQSGVTFPEGQEPLKSLDPSITVSKPSGATFADAVTRLVDQLFTGRFPSHPNFGTDRQLTTNDFNHVAGALRRAAGDAQYRTDLAPTERKLASAILTPLNLAQVYDTHLIFNEDAYGAKLTDIDTQLRRHGLDPAESVTVQAVYNAVEQLHPTGGLNQDTITLFVAAWAAARDRSWAHHGSTLTVEPALREIDQRMELQPVTLPDLQEWKDAVEAAGLLFGIK
ncbi:MAG TPA: phage resistance protein, partial [Corynebacterium sp.]|nr:phage resistance protein [Corynebacterium sp.]